MIVTPDVEDHVLGTVVGLFLAQHAAVSLIDSVASHAEIADGLPQVTREILLPRFRIADLVALSEAVAIGVDPAFPAGVRERCPAPLGWTVEMVVLLSMPSFGR